jgi:hypothetical protein
LHHLQNRLLLHGRLPWWLGRLLLLLLLVLLLLLLLLNQLRLRIGRMTIAIRAWW